MSEWKERLLGEIVTFQCGFDITKKEPFPVDYPVVSSVKQNASIDWTIKESVKAKLKVIVKRTLRQYGYPPDMQRLATETVLNKRN